MVDMERPLKLVIVSVVVILLIMVLTAGIIVQRKAGGAGADVGLIILTIDGENANISAEIDISPTVDKDGTDLKLDIGNPPIILDYRGDHISASLTENDFRELVERVDVNITGKVKTRLIGPLDMTFPIKEKVNISFIHELSESMNVTNVTVKLFPFSDPVINFDIQANVSSDFQLNITNTKAKLTSPIRVFDANIRNLHFRTGEGGHAEISIPPLNLLGLALYTRGIMVEAWGITIQVDIPLFNG
jgi:hypothetical protein